MLHLLIPAAIIYPFVWIAFLYSQSGTEFLLALVFLILIGGWAYIGWLSLCANSYRIGCGCRVSGRMER
jgi:hypothetical protein